MTFIANTGDVFSVATLLYARLRRVNGRVIDVVYLMQDRHYAHHVVDLALETKDAELAEYVQRLQIALALEGAKPQAEPNANSGDTVAVKKKTALEEGHMSFSLF